MDSGAGQVMRKVAGWKVELVHEEKGGRLASGTNERSHQLSKHRRWQRKQ